MKAFVPMLGAAALVAALAMPVGAQTMDDYGTMTCGMWSALDAPGKIQAANGLQAFVKESANHDLAGASAQLLDGKTVEEVTTVVDNGCVRDGDMATLIQAVNGN